MINRYETFKRSDGHTVKLPPDKWEGQQFASKPGNLYSRAVNMAVDPSTSTTRASCSTRRSRRFADFKQKETKYVKYLRIRSELLSKFWGRDMFLGAWSCCRRGYSSTGRESCRARLTSSPGHHVPPTSSRRSSSVRTARARCIS